MHSFQSKSRYSLSVKAISVWNAVVLTYPVKKKNTILLILWSKACIYSVGAIFIFLIVPANSSMPQADPTGRLWNLW